MAVERVAMYRVVCDRCGTGDDDAEYYAWTDDSQAIDVARESEWLITDDGHHYCPGCVVWDEEEDELVAVAPSTPKEGDE